MLSMRQEQYGSRTTLPDSCPIADEITVSSGRTPAQTLHKRIVPLPSVSLAERRRHRTLAKADGFSQRILPDLHFQLAASMVAKLDSPDSAYATSGPSRSSDD
jgi:hypothetical protein